MSRIAEEVHRSKIHDLESRITEMEKEHKVRAKAITDSEEKIKELERKFFKSVVINAKMEATIATVLKLGERENQKNNTNLDE